MADASSTEKGAAEEPEPEPEPGEPGSTASKAGSPSLTSSADHWLKEYHLGPSFDQDIAIPPLAVTAVPL